MEEKNENVVEETTQDNVATLEEISSLYLYDFGIFIQLQPDEEEKMLLENNIQVALQQQSIDLEDAIDVREIKSLKLANQILKIRRKKKQQRDQALQERNIQLQSQSNMQSQQTAAQLDMQKNKVITENEMMLIQAKSESEAKKLIQETELKKELMNIEFQYNMQLKNAETEGLKNREKEKEDRKDERTRIQASQQSEMIEQRNTNKPPKNFESAGNDIMGGGFDLGAFEPR